eukprot:s1186_g17.t1
MVRMKYSQAIRKAEFSRARRAASWGAFQCGDIVYFYREQKVAPGSGARGTRQKRLFLKQWHGPGIIAALEGGRIPTAAYVSYRGNLTKCSIEHLRPASTLERLVATEWEEVISEMINSTDETLPDDNGEDPGAPHELPPGDEGFEPTVPEAVAAPQDDLHSSSSAARGIQYPYPFSSQELYPLIQVASGLSAGGAPSMSSSFPTHSRTPSKVSAQSSFTAPAGGPEPVLPAVPEGSAAEDNRLERAQGAVRRALSEGAVAREPEAKRRVFEPLILGGKSIEVLLSEQDTCIHPLLKAVIEAQHDIENAYREVPDHGSWDGRWSLPSQSTWELFEEAKWIWPTGSPTGSEVLEAQASGVSAGNHKELRWSGMDEETRNAFREAAVDQWQKWVENQAVRVLSLQQSRAVYQELERKGELNPILQPRFVLTDKNASHRTPTCPLPLKASARIVVPGYLDLANLRNELRRDAPTGSRLAQHLLFTIAAAHPSWYLRAADVRAAFLKGDPYIQRVLYIKETDVSRGPSIPVPHGCVAQVLKGVFGLADAPREWWLRLDRELREEGWTRSVLDGALWFRWTESPETEGKKKLSGVIVGHVDDLLFTGNDDALRSLMKLGDKLGYGSVESESFTWCGKQIRRDPQTKEIVVSMKVYHEQLKPQVVPRSRRQNLDDKLNPAEVKRLRGVLGSLQWLVAQIRFDLAFAVSSLQSESHTIGTLLRANKVLVDAKRDGDFELRFRRIPLDEAGIVVVTDAALGNVDEQGGTSGETCQKVHSQSCYCVMLADPGLLKGQKGTFSVLDFRSHRIPRVCRSSYAAETLGAEEGLDAAELCRAFVAEARGLPIYLKDGALHATRVPLVGVTDAKDTFDSVTRDTGFGNQKSLMFSISSIRQQLRRPQTSYRWTATANMFVDAGTKWMDAAHLRSTLSRGEWSIEYRPEFVKQTSKKKPAAESVVDDADLPGRPLSSQDQLLMEHVQRLSESAGWHFVEGVGIHVAHQAGSFRSPAGQEADADTRGDQSQDSLQVVAARKGKKKDKALRLD